MIEKKELDDALRKMGRKHLKKPYKDRWTSERPTTGYCYVVSEVYYHYCAPKGSKPHFMKLDENETHWFIKHPDGSIVDLTADQFDEPVDYEKARPHAFQTKNISKRGRILADLLGLSKNR